MPSRRQLLLGAAASLAGCLGPRPATPPDGTGSTPADGTDSTPTDETTPETDSPTPTTSYELGESHETDDGASVTVSAADVRVSIVSRHVAGSSTHPDVGVADGGQFLVVDHTPRDPASFGVRIDGERIGRQRYDPVGPDDGMTAFEVPLVDADSAGVVWVGGEQPVRWELPDAVVADLGVRPAFEVQRFEVVDAVEPGDPIGVTLEVANLGDRDGRFLAELGAVVLSDIGEVAFDVPQGETVRREFSLRPATYTPMYGSGEDELTVVLNWGTDRMERTVTLLADTETAS